MYTFSDPPVEDQIPDMIHNKYSGSCIVIGNGNSLGDIPFQFLADYPCIGCNDIFLYETVFGYPLKLVAYSNLGNTHFETEEHIRDLERTATITDNMFINREVWNVYNRFAYLPCPVYSIIGHPERLAGSEGLFPRAYFSMTPLSYIGVGYTQTYCNLQLAYYMGFHTVYLVGIDHDYGSMGRHFYPESKSRKREDVRDFQDNMVYCRGADAVYQNAKEVFEAVGRKIINCTIGKSTSVFPITVVK